MKKGEHPFFQDTFALAVNDPDGPDAGPDAFTEIGVQQVRDFGGTKQMQVKDIFYGNDNRFHDGFYHSTGKG